MKFFEQATPEQVGISSAAVIDFIDVVKTEQINLHGFIMLKGDRVFCEGYYAPFHQEFEHRMYSVGKSFTALAVGFLEEEGKIALDDTICTFFSDKYDWNNLHPYLKKTTIKDMLCMATPHGYTSYKKIDDEDWVRSFFTAKPDREPGQNFCYDTSSTHVLGALVERLTGKTLIGYLNEKLLSKIGCTPTMRFLPDPLGVSQGGSGLVCTLRDVARVAWVCTQQGVYKGEQVLPNIFLKEALSKKINTPLQPVIEEQQGYGYHIWRTRHEGFAFYGIGGQLAICLPQYGFVLTTYGDTLSDPTGVQSIYNALWKCILPELKKQCYAPIIQDFKSQQILSKRLSELKVSCVNGAISSDIVPEINSRTYVFPKNPMAFCKCSFIFDSEKETCTLFYTNATGEHELCFGFGHMEMQLFPDTAYDCIGSAAWIDNGQLHLKADLIGDCFAGVYMTATFDKNRLTLAMKRILEPFLDQYDGYVSGKILI